MASPVIQPALPLVEPHGGRAYSKQQGTATMRSRRLWRPEKNRRMGASIHLAILSTSRSYSLLTESKEVDRPPASSLMR